MTVCRAPRSSRGGIGTGGLPRIQTTTCPWKKAGLKTVSPTGLWKERELWLNGGLSLYLDLSLKMRNFQYRLSNFLSNDVASPSTGISTGRSNGALGRSRTLTFEPGRIIYIHIVLNIILFKLPAHYG